MLEGGELPSDLGERVAELVQGRRVHLLDGSETSQFLPEAHDLAHTLLRPLRVEVEDIHGLHTLVLRGRQSTLAICRSVVVVGSIQTGPFEELLLCLLRGQFVRLRASAGNLFGGYVQDLCGISLGGRLELERKVVGQIRSTPLEATRLQLTSAVVVSTGMPS